MPSDVISRRLGRVSESTPPAYFDADGPIEGPGWLWRDDEAEESFRTLIRNLDRTIRAMVSGEATSPEDVRKLQLATCRAAMHSAEAAGRPVPQFVTDVYNEIIEGRFR